MALQWHGGTAGGSNNVCDVIFLFAVSAHDGTNTPQLLETLQSKDEEVQT